MINPFYHDPRPSKLFDVKDGTLMKFYNQFYSSEKRWIYNEEKERQILENYIIKPANWLRGDYLLEIGCGQGFHSNLLQSLGYQITGIDMSVSAIKTAQAESSGADFICGDLSTFKPEKKYKGILCRGMSWFHYELNDELKKKLRHIFEWLESDGIFVLQIVTDFSGSRPEGKVHNNIVEQYLELFKGVGTLISITDWVGKKLKIGEKGNMGVIVTVAK